MWVATISATSAFQSTIWRKAAEIKEKKLRVWDGTSGYNFLRFFVSSFLRFSDTKKTAS